MTANTARTKSKVPAWTGVALLIAVSLLPLLVAGIGWARGAFTIGCLSAPVFTGALAQPGFYTLNMGLSVACGCIAIVTALLCLIHFHTTGAITTQLMSAGLFVSGLLDIGLLLAGEKVLLADSGSDAFFALSWDITRLFYIVVLIVGCAFFVLQDRVRSAEDRKRSMVTTGIWGGVFVLIGAGIMYAIVGQPDWIVSLYGSSVHRILWNFSVLALVLIAAGYVFPTFHSYQKSLFTGALWLSCLPLAVSQLLFCCGLGDSTAVLFSLANSLKLLAYLFPLFSLAIDYKATYLRLDQANRELRNRLFMFEQTKDVSKQGQRVLDVLMGNLHVPVCVLDASMHVTLINRAQGILSSCPDLAQAVHKSAEEILGVEAAARMLPLCRQALDTNAEIASPTEPLRYPDGVVRRISWSMRPALNEKGFPVSIVCVGRES